MHQDNRVVVGSRTYLPRRYGHSHRHRSLVDCAGVTVYHRLGSVSIVRIGRPRIGCVSAFWVSTCRAALAPAALRAALNSGHPIAADGNRLPRYALHSTAVSPRGEGAGAAAAAASCRNVKRTPRISVSIPCDWTSSDVQKPGFQTK